MLKIWGRANSSNVQKVLWCCEELALPFERVDIGGIFGGDKEQPYLSLNPNGLIPTVEDGDLVLWESNTILRYLASRYVDGPKGRRALVPDDLGKRADIERWMDWQLSILTAPMSVLFWNLVRTPPDKRDASAIQAAQKKAAAAWDILDRHLAARAYVGGTNFTIGDIPIGIQGWRWLHLPIERPAQPHLNDWIHRLMARPGYQKHVALPLN